MSFKLDKSELKAARAHMARINARLGAEFVDAAQFADGPMRALPPGMQRALRNKHFLVQEYYVPHDTVICRLSIQRTMLDDRGGWVDGITWDQLQQVKSAVGYGDHDAIEIYPRDENVVNVANMRHLWILAEPLAFAWQKSCP
jgi:hypothetical protein